MTENEQKYLPLIGYSDRLSVRPGQTIEFKVSAQSDGPVDAWLTRSISADPNPDGPGIVELAADDLFERRRFTGRRQAFHPGSYGMSTSEHAIGPDDDIEIGAIVFPMLRKDTPQTIISVGELALRQGTDGLELKWGHLLFRTGSPLPLRKWQQVTVAYDAKTRRIVLSQGLVDAPAVERVFEWRDGDEPRSSHGSILIAAEDGEDGVSGHFNGKIEAPFLRVGATGERIAWDLSRSISTTTCPASSGEDDDLHLVNFPARGMTGSRWDASEMCWRHAPELYGAIHFHETDIYDFGWETDLVFEVPEDCPSGVYVMHIRSGDAEDAMPFYVCAPFRAPRARLCVLIPTFTYVIYGNHARPDYDPSWQKTMKDWNAYPYNPFEYPNYGLSTYNMHPDRSGICHGSHRRPLLNLRPGFVTFGSGESSGLRHMPADSHLISWLHHEGIPFDVITDQELHDEGVAAIEKYACVTTCSHPEYHTVETLDAMQAYRDRGGNFVYLGGNGFYWKIVPHPDHPAVFEIRRGEGGIRAWAAEPGEYYHAFNGAYGGLWRRNGRPPQMLAGIGFTAQGEFHGSYYRRTCREPRYDWIFDGIDGDIIGDFGFSGGGAAGFELDRADERLGTPENVVVLARSEGHGADFIPVPEEMLTHLTTWSGEAARDIIRADMIYCELPGGGRIFSTGSIAFCGSLPWNGFDNNVSTLLANVLRAFLS